MTNPSQPRLLDQVRDALRSGHRSRRTEDAYVQWIRPVHPAHRKRHPRDMGRREITEFLTTLAVRDRMSAPRHRTRP